MYEGPAVAFMPQGPEGPWSGPACHAIFNFSSCSMNYAQLIKWLVRWFKQQRTHARTHQYEVESCWKSERWPLAIEFWWRTQTPLQPTRDDWLWHSLQCVNCSRRRRRCCRRRRSSCCSRYRLILFFFLFIFLFTYRSLLLLLLLLLLRYYTVRTRDDCLVHIGLCQRDLTPSCTSHLLS